MYLFDLDGTLIDSNGIWAEVDRTFLARRGYPYTKEYYEGVAHTFLPIPRPAGGPFPRGRGFAIRANPEPRSLNAGMRHLE